MTEVPDNVTVEEYFKDHVYKQVEETLGGGDFSWLTGKEMTLQYDLDGKKYGVRIKDGNKAEVLEGGIDRPMLEIAMSEGFWRDMVTGRRETGMDFILRSAGGEEEKERMDSLKDVKGTLKIELEVDGGEENATMIFNGEAQPEATISLVIDEFVAMRQGETDGQTLVMSGKMQFDGDLMFLLSVQNML